VTATNFVQSQPKQLAPKGILVNGVAPSPEALVYIWKTMANNCPSILTQLTKLVKTRGYKNKAKSLLNLHLE